MWLKADTGVTTNMDGSVATMDDQSGNGNNAAQDISLGYPSPMLGTDYAGRPVLSFDGTIKYLIVPDSISLEQTNDMSLFCSLSVANVTNVNMVCTKGFLAQPHPFSYSFNSTHQQAASRGDNRGTSTVLSSAAPAGTNIVCGFTVSGSTGTDYLQGLAAGTGQYGFGTIDDGTQLYIGTRDALDLYFNGNIGEILMYDHALSASDLQLANAYLAGRSGVGTAQFATKPPALNVAVSGTNSVVSWVAGYTGYILEGRTNLLTGSWTPIITNPPNNQISIPTTNRARFFRLHGQ
jgi:hypothetical protein